MTKVTLFPNHVGVYSNGRFSVLSEPRKPTTQSAERSLASFATFPPGLANPFLTSSKPNLATQCCPSQPPRPSRSARAFKGQKCPGVSTMIPLFASIMATSGQQLTGVAEYKAESQMAKTSISGEKDNPSLHGPAADEFIFIPVLVSNPLQPSHNHRRRLNMTGRQAHSLPVADMTLALSLALFP